MGIMLDSYFTVYSRLGDSIYWFYFYYSRPILDVFHILFKAAFNLFLVLTIILAMFYLVMSVAVMFKKRQKRYILPRGKEPKVTVQIPTYNELAAINCAKKCLEFDYPRDKLQIIIGDDSNEPRISKAIREFAKQHDIVKVTRRGNNEGYKPGNLNHMLKYTDGEFIVIFDSDFLPHKTFLRRIIAPFVHDPNIAVVQARWKIYNYGQNMISVLGGTISVICHHVALPFITSYNGCGSLCGSAEAIRKRDLVDAGGWQTGSLTEDIECSLRLIQRGKRLLYLEDLECSCEAPYTFQDLCKQQMRWSYGVISALKSHLRRIMGQRDVPLRDKVSVVIFASGYIFSLLLLGITVFGMLSVLSNQPALIDWPRFISETGRNIALTSGFLVASVIALAASHKRNYIMRMVAACLSMGLIVTYYVNVGIMKAIFGRDMKWYMLNKKGNEFLE